MSRRRIAARLLGLRGPRWINHAPEQPSRVAFVTLGPLWPLQAGATIRHAAVFDALARAPAASAWFVQRDEPSVEQVRWAQGQKPSIGWVPRPDSTWRGRAAIAALAVLRAEPVGVATMRLARHACGSPIADRIVAGQGAASGFVRSHERADGALCTLDFDPEYAAHRAATAGRWWRRALHRLDARLARRYYRSVYADFGTVVAISAEDAEQIRHASPTASVEHIPLSIDTSSVDEARPIERLVFVGAGERNLDSIRYSIRSVLPHLADDPKPLELFGRSNEHELAAIDRWRRDGGLPESSVVPPTFVDDVGDVLRPGALLLAPYERGAGVKVKCLDAMLRGALVATTPAGARGTPLRDGVNGIVRDTGAEIAASIAELIADPHRAIEIAERGRADALTEHGPGVHRSRWAAIVAGRHHTPHPEGARC